MTAFWLNFNWILTEFWLHFDCILTAFWLHFDCILIEFWLHFEMNKMNKKKQWEVSVDLLMKESSVRDNVTICLKVISRAKLVRRHDSAIDLESGNSLCAFSGLLTLSIHPRSNGFGNSSTLHNRNRNKLLILANQSGKKYWYCCNSLYKKIHFVCKRIWAIQK